MTFASAQRAPDIELVDAGDYTGDEIRDNLADLRFFNKWLGGARLMRRQVAPLMGGVPAGSSITLLDIATGSGDIPAVIASWARGRGVTMHPLGLDVSADVLGEARRRHIAGDSIPHFVRAASVRLPHADASIDFAISSNFLHHLDDDAALATLREMKRVARRGVVVIDLMRTRAALSLVWLATRITTTNRLTRHDGPLSVARAFTVAELGRLVDKAGFSGAIVRRAGPVRMVMVWNAGGRA